MMRWSLPSAVLLLLILGGFFLGFSGSVDDAHITYWAAESLARYGEILNYNLDRVEQSSALLQVIVLGVLRAVTGLSVVMLGHVTTIAIAMAALFLYCRLIRQLAISSMSIFLLASAPFFVYWTFGGMEGPWLSALLLLLLWVLPTCLQSRGISLSVFFLSLAIQTTRPEMPWLMIGFAFSLFFVRNMLLPAIWPWRALLSFLVLQCVAAASLAAWRYGYFGDYFPQPVRAKTSGISTESFLQGVSYLQQAWGNIWLLPMATLTILGAVWLVRVDRRPLLILAVLLAGIYSGFVMASGGDWMAAGRFWTPIMPILCLLVAWLLDRWIKNTFLHGIIIALLVMMNVSYLVRGTALDFNGIPLWKETVLTASEQSESFSFFERHARENLHDIPATLQAQALLEKSIGMRAIQKNDTPIVLMAGQMGMVPFYLSKQFAGEIRFIDRNGITERTLTTCSTAAGLPRTRNGLGVGYEWILVNRAALETACGFVMPDIVFDIETGWNRRNIQALEQAGYVFVYRQRGHIFNEPDDALLPLRKIGAGEFLAVSQKLWQQLGSPAPIKRVF
ncbi:MAG: hypothetical protein R3E61_11180 [Pseudomonadales bacterium]